jgi:hypothetical protein
LDEFWETANKPWLFDAIERGDNFRFVSDPNKASNIYQTVDNKFVFDSSGNRIKSIFGREIDYLRANGYEVLADGTAVRK